MSNFFVALAVFIITVVGALFTVPYFIDWNGYRGVFEEEASRLLDREVRVGGAVNLHLLPTPYFRFEKVRIADASVNLEEPFFRTDSVTVKLSVPPLLRGAVEAHEIEFQRPVLRLALNDKGGWNWQTFGQVLSNAPYLPTNVALTSLKIKDGVLAVHGTNGAERARIEGSTASCHRRLWMDPIASAAPTALPAPSAKSGCRRPRPRMTAPCASRPPCASAMSARSTTWTAACWT